jgi:hypothetical protein
VRGGLFFNRVLQGVLFYPGAFVHPPPPPPPHTHTPTDPHTHTHTHTNPHASSPPAPPPQVPTGPRTLSTLRNNVSVSIQYMEAWLGGNGCVPLYNLMEDAATAEISRSQVGGWAGWVGAQGEGGAPVWNLNEDAAA